VAHFLDVSLLLPPLPKVMGGYVFAGENFLAPIQVPLSPNFVNHTIGQRERGD